MRWISLISSGHSIQMQKNTHSSQVYMEHSPGYTTSWVTNQTSVNLRKFEVISSIFSDNNVMRLDINYKKKNCKNTNTWRLNNMYLENNWLLKRSKGKSKNFQKKMTKHDNSKHMGCSKSSSRRDYYPTSSNKKKHHLDSLTLCLK